MHVPPPGTFADVSIDGNAALSVGAGVHVANTATVVIRDSRITNNVIQQRNTHGDPRHNQIGSILGGCSSCPWPANLWWAQGEGAGLAVCNYLKDAMPHVTGQYQRSKLGAVPCACGAASACCF